jgi:hypothetical protein
MCNHPVRGVLIERERLEAALERAERLADKACPDSLTIMTAARSHLATLPRPPRPVTVSRYVVVDASGYLFSTYALRREAEALQATMRGARVVLMTGQYDE